VFELSDWPIGFCKRGEGCWFLHVSDSKDKQAVSSLVEEVEEDEPCSICFEQPTTYGLLGTCYSFVLQSDLLTCF